MAERGVGRVEPGELPDPGCDRVDAEEAGDGRGARGRRYGGGRGAPGARGASGAQRWAEAHGQAAAGRERQLRARPERPGSARGHGHRAVRPERRRQHVGQGRAAEPGVAQDAEDLGTEVPSQAPGLELAEHHRVDGLPRLRGIAAEAGAGSRLEARDHERQRHPALLPGDPRVDTRGVPVERAPDVIRGRRQVALRRLSPAQRPDQPVRVQLALPEQLREPAAPDVPEDLHLPHPLRCVDEPLREEEVVRGVGHDLGDPGRVAVDRDRRGKPGDPQRAGGLGQGAGAHPREQAAGGDERDEHHDEQARQQATEDAHHSLPGTPGRVPQRVPRCVEVCPTRAGACRPRGPPPRAGSRPRRPGRPGRRRGA